MEAKENVTHDEETKFTGSIELNKCHLQEHEPLHHLLSILPQKAQKGLSSLPIEYTCIDVSPEYIALGTSVGLVLLYDRLGQSLQRLNCKIKTEVITCVKLAESVDYVVAAGTQGGKVFVFQLPSLLPGRAKRMQLYCVSDVHFSQITCVEWSQNTLKLFSGDQDGCVACSEMDYAEQQSKSYIVAEEPHEIVQLDYSFKRLLVSTMFRSFICTPGVSEKNRIGKKDRKILGPFAACFKPELCRPEDATIFATRPGLRLWKADMEGNVQTTYMFKDLLGGNTPVLVLLPDTTHGHSTAMIEEMTFGRLKAYSESMLVTWHEATLFVLNPDRGTFEGWHSNLENIKGLSVCQDEIFILRDSPGRRKVIRIAQKRDLLNEPVLTKHVGLPTSSIGGQHQPSHSPVHILQQTATNLADAILGVGEKMKGVKEGHTPPWGLAEDPNTPSSPDLDSCKEANSQSSGSSGVTSPDMEHSNRQPTILLDSPDTLTVILQEEDKTSASAVDKPTFGTISVKPERSSGSRDTINKLASSDGCSSTDIKPDRLTHLSTTSVEDDDIVFTTKVKKGRKKRTKSDKDTESIGSVDSSSVGIDGTPDFTLEGFEKDAAAHRSQAFTYTPDFGSASNRPSAENEPGFEALVDTAFEQLPLESSNNHKIRTGSITGQKEVEIIKPEESYSVTQIQQSSSSDLPIENSQMQKDKELVTRSKPDVIDSPYSDLIERLISDNENKPPGVENTSETDPKDSDFLNEMIGDAADGFSGDTEIIHDASEEHSKSQDTHVGTELNQPVSSNSNFSSKSNEPQQIYTTSDSSTDDFYSKFKRGNSIVSPGWSPEEEPSIEEAIEKGKLTEALQVAARKDLQNRLADTWTEFLAPGNLISICLTHRHIWCVDKSDRLHYSGLSGPGLKWRKVDEPAKQISVSRSGWIVWRLYNGSAYAGTAITTRAPAGMKWVEAARDVSFIAVDNTIAWYIKSNGEISVQKNISRERPSYKAKKVACQAKLLQVVCQDDVVWVVTEARSILIRMGIKAGTEEGTDWRPIDKEGTDLVVSYLAFGDNGTAWVVDVVGRVWFTTGIRWDNPSGTGKWWQVSLSEYLMEDYKAVDILATFPQNLSKIIAKEKGGLIAVGSNGIWICPGCKHVLHVCRGGITGHRFNAVVPSGMATSAKWLNVSAGAVDNENGLIWAQQPNNAVFCFPSHNKKFSEVSHPEFSSPFVSISSTKEAVWGLLGDGRVVIRGGMAAHCPQGINWISLDLIQLGSAKLVHLSCSTEGVWGVDNNGMVYLRIGIKPPGRSDHGYLNPAWVPVDGTTQGTGAKFNKVFAGPTDWMVWAIDTKKQVYARKGISDSMPIGTRWSYIPGTTAEKLCLSERYVYALNTHGEVLVRFGVSPDNPGGDYWKKVPGAFKEITATTQDEVWGINHDGQLCQRAVYYLQRQDVLEDLSEGPVGRDSVGDDWELI